MPSQLPPPPDIEPPAKSHSSQVKAAGLPPLGEGVEADKSAVAPGFGRRGDRLDLDHFLGAVRRLRLLDIVGTDLLFLLVGQLLRGEDANQDVVRQPLTRPPPELDWNRAMSSRTAMWMIIEPRPEMEPSRI